MSSGSPDPTIENDVVIRRWRGGIVCREYLSEHYQVAIEHFSGIILLDVGNTSERDCQCIRISTAVHN